MKIFGAWNDEVEEFSEDLEINETEDIREEEWQIALDIIENSDELIIVSPIAWVELFDIDISLKNDIIIISWERKKEEELYNKDSIIRVSENFWGKFSRNIILPENLDLDNIKAILEKNILVIRIPKLKFKGQSIEIEKIDDNIY